MFYKKGDPIRCIRFVRGLVLREGDREVKYQKALYQDEVYWVDKTILIGGSEVLTLKGMGSTRWPGSLFIPLDMREFTHVVYTGNPATAGKRTQIQLKDLEPK